MQPRLTDEQILALVPRCQRGEPAAVEAIYDLYSDRLYRYLLTRLGDPDAAAELTTEVFVRMIQHIGSFKLSRKDPANVFSGWLYRIAANLVSDFYRSRKWQQVELPDDLPAPVNGPDPYQQAVQHETAQQLGTALNQLSEDQRLVIVGRFAEEMSTAEVAAWLGKTEGAVKSLQHRALRTLGRLLALDKRRDPAASGEST
ncbi:MAG: sigma-70 family RNA polymerase sigma factor [Caldilineae bacterium]|nr:sigma-70 family RNA polymerase sigma factor [Anaerolineae bacterium]MCB0203282.1 sigma-70 family RNA polymerase sigma factor [Anaerolineae bacterium]MCB9154020.1 sigma-70 family RNA polymerase sigma factor [Caldilineae bacterium]